MAEENKNNSNSPTPTISEQAELPSRMPTTLVHEKWSPSQTDGHVPSSNPTRSISSKPSVSPSPPPSFQNPACDICGEGKVISRPNTLFEVPGASPVTCSFLETAGLTGQLPRKVCAAVQPGGYFSSEMASCECIQDPTILKLDLASHKPSISPSSSKEGLKISASSPSPTTHFNMRTTKSNEPTSPYFESDIAFSSENGEEEFLNVDDRSQKPSGEGNAGWGIGMGLLIVTPLTMLVLGFLFEIKRRKRATNRNKTILPLRNNPSQKGNFLFVKNHFVAADDPVDKRTMSVQVSQRKSHKTTKCLGDIMTATLQQPTDAAKISLKHIAVAKSAESVSSSKSKINAMNVGDNEDKKEACGAQSFTTVCLKSKVCAESVDIATEMKETSISIPTSSVDMVVTENVSNTLSIKNVNSSKSERSTKSTTEMKETSISTATSTDDMVVTENVSNTLSIKNVNSSNSERSTKSTTEMKETSISTATSSDDMVVTENVSNTLSIKNVNSSNSERSTKSTTEMKETSISTATSSDDMVVTENVSNTLSIRNGNNSNNERSAKSICVVEPDENPIGDVEPNEKLSDNTIVAQNPSSVVMKKNDPTLFFELLSSLQMLVQCNGDTVSDSSPTDLV